MTSGSVGTEPNLDGLAKAWADDECVRSLLLHKKSLLAWPSSKKTGVITFENYGAKCTSTFQSFGDLVSTNGSSKDSEH